MDEERGSECDVVPMVFCVCVCVCVCVSFFFRADDGPATCGWMGVARMRDVAEAK